MIFIYTHHLTPRLEYVSEHLFKNILGVDYRLNTDKEAFLSHAGPSINYSPEPLNKGIHILPHGLLSETGVRPVDDLKQSTWDDLFCFFSNGGQQIPFDILAASFYLLTLYEEYFPTHLDMHLRFDPRESLAYKNEFLEVPLIDRWAYKLKDIFVSDWKENIDFKLRKYRMISTFDIDHPYLYKNKGVAKNIYGALRDTGRRNWSGLMDRLRVLLHVVEDPYLKVLYWLDEFHKKSGREYYLFILLSRYGKYGRSTIYSQRKYHEYVKSLTNVKIGLHASYKTLLDRIQTQKEKVKLESLLEWQVFLNRQHYLRLQTPGTFRILSELGFKEDFSLSYAKQPGFRSGTAVPHPFFDVENNRCTSLLIRPTVVMDSCLIIHLGLAPEEALVKLKKLSVECKLSGGDFLMLWHNSNLSGKPEQNPWIKIFIESYQYALSLENGNFGAE